MKLHEFTRQYFITLTQNISGHYSVGVNHESQSIMIHTVPYITEPTELWEDAVEDAVFWIKERALERMEAITDEAV